VADGAFIRSFPCCGYTAFSPNGTLIGVATNPVRVYRTSDWTQVSSLSDQNQALAFSPDGLYLVAVGGNQLQFWRVSDWTLQRFYDQELNAAGFGVTSLAFSPDGVRFGYGRYDATILVARNPFAPTSSDTGYKINMQSP
jgi:WD40 repeat protein